jgi:hypothetical protein
MARTIKQAQGCREGFELVDDRWEPLRPDLGRQPVITCHANNCEDDKCRGQARGLVQPLDSSNLPIRRHSGFMKGKHLETLNDVVRTRA